MTITEEEKKRRKDLAEFQNINYMRAELGMPLLVKGWVDCISGCGKTFYSYDLKGNRMCEDCKAQQIQEDEFYNMGDYLR